MRTQRRNRRRYTPIPYLAEHIKAFNRGEIKKHNLADAIAAFADKVYACTYRERKITQ